MEAAYTACTRITRLLQDSEGHNWRSKLPPHPDAERVKAALSEHKYRSGSLGGVSSLSAVVNVDQSGISGVSDVSDEGAADVNGSSATHRDSLTSETSNFATASGGISSAEPTDSGKRKSTGSVICVLVCIWQLALDLCPLQVTQTTHPVSSPHYADAPPTGPTLSQMAPEQKFEQLKAEGNEHVKKVSPLLCDNCIIAHD